MSNEFPKNIPGKSALEFPEKFSQKLPGKYPYVFGRKIQRNSQENSGDEIHEKCPKTFTSKC